MLFPDDRKRHEIIDGEHYVTPSPNLRHLSPLDVVLSHWDVVEPDLLFVAGDQSSILAEKNAATPRLSACRSG